MNKTFSLKDERKIASENKLNSIVARIEKEAIEWASGYPGRSAKEKSAWADGAVAMMAVIDPTFAISNAVLYALDELWEL